MHLKFFNCFLVGVGHFPKSLKKIKHEKAYLNDEKHPIFENFDGAKLS